MRWIVWLLGSWLVLLVAPSAFAETLHVPVGGSGVAFGGGRIACGPAPNGWILEGAGRAVRPPTASSSIGHPVELAVATAPEACGSAASIVRLVATGAIPSVDASSIALFVDDGRLEAQGKNLARSVVSWPGANGLESGSCADTINTGGADRCAWPVSKELSTDPAASMLRIWPQGALPADDAVVFDAEGRKLSLPATSLTPKRVQIGSALRAEASVDVSQGFGFLPLLHPEAIVAVECKGADCKLDNGKLRVAAPVEGVTAIEARFTVRPGLLTAKPGPLVSRVSILRCPMEPVSGPAFRGMDSARTIVRLGGACAKDVTMLRFFAGTRSIDVADTYFEADGTYVVLALGNVDTQQLTLSAVRSGAEGAVVGLTRVPTRPQPAARTVLEIPGFPGVDFLPYNRDAVVHFPKIDGGELVLLPVEGVYTVHKKGANYMVRGDRDAAGLVTFQFAFRAAHLPMPMGDVNLGRFHDPLQRAVKEANEPAPFASTADTKKPIAELLCYDADGRTQQVKPGVRERYAFRLRDGCRLVLHRDRLNPEQGAQKVHIEIEVRKLDGSLRSEASVSERLVLRPGKESKVAWIKGVLSPYDSVIVRLTQEGDENHYLGGEALVNGAPALQWAVVFGTGRVRIYATTAIPTGLYRFGGKEGSGNLALNFGVISRMTWLDRDGKEGLLGLEAGVMAFGLTGSNSTAGQPLTQVGAVFGLGLTIPIANASQVSQAAINLHGWIEQRITGSGPESASPRAFIFGPSISIGNVGGTF